MTAYERALLEQIAFLEDELERYRAARSEEQPEEDVKPIDWAMRDPNFRQWLLRRQLESTVRP